MKQYLPRTALAVLLGLACVAAQGKTFKCLSDSRLDCPTTTDLETSTLSGTSDVETTTFRNRGSGGNSSNASPVNTGGSSVNAPPISSIATPVPEPETYAMMALGMGVVAWSLRRRRRA